MLDVCMGLGQSTYSQPAAYGAAVTTYVSASPYGVVSSGYAAPSEQPPAYGQPSYVQPGETYFYVAEVGPNRCSGLILSDSEMNLLINYNDYNRFFINETDKQQCDLDDHGLLQER